MIVLIVGDSGSGKSSIVKSIANKMSDINVIKSYTTRPRRNEFDNDHTFINSKEEIKDEIVASTEINGYFYGASKSQFKENKINLYIVDDKGVMDVKKYFVDEDILTVRINRNDKKIKIPAYRKNREIMKLGIKYDKEIDNNDHLLDAVNGLMECIRKYKRKN